MSRPPPRNASLRAAIAGVLLCLASLAGGCTLELPTNDPPGADGGTRGGDGAGGAAVPTSSGVPRDTRLMELTFDQASALCDWTNQKQGGYRRIVPCSSNNDQSTSASTAACVTRLLGLGGQCPALAVANVEDCATATGTDLCQVLSAPACSPLLACSS